MLKSKPPRKIYLILDNLRSAYNVGAIFRTADAIGVDKIFLCGITPTPGEQKQGNRRVKKTAIGAENYISWKYAKNTLQLINQLKKKKIFIASLEQTLDAQKYISIKLNKIHFPLALIVGNELNGVGEDALKKSDIKIFLPMLGQKKSLNVTTSVGIILYYLRFEID